MYLKISESHRILLVPSQEKFTRPFVFLPWKFLISHFLSLWTMKFRRIWLFSW
jgi:hypothetical protein